MKIDEIFERHIKRVKKTREEMIKERDRKIQEIMDAFDSEPPVKLIERKIASDEIKDKFSAYENVYYTLSW